MSSELVPAAQPVVESEAAGRKALSKLPADWAEPVGYFCACKLYLLKTRLPLVMNLKYWMAKGLALGEAKVIFRRLCDPDVARNHNFENQLMADLAGMVADVLRRKRMVTEMMRRRQAAADPAGPAAAVVRVADRCDLPSRVTPGAHWHARRHHRAGCRCEACRTDGTSECSAESPCPTCLKESERPGK
jgi:hypothetical protein